MTAWSVWLILSFLTGLGPAEAPAAPTPATHSGICDASTAVAVAPGKFLVANDECAHVAESNACNKLLVYDAEGPGRALQEIDVTPFMALDKVKKEADIEGSAALDGRVYWITSHGRNKDGEIKKNRYRLFATEVKTDGGKIALAAAGKPYADLLKNILADETFRSFTRERLDPGNDPSLAAEGKEAINIEGLSAWKAGQLLIGFRNPVPQGLALLVPLENPAELLSQPGKTARFGAPIRLDLGGRGIRSIEYWKERDLYLIVGGPIGKPDPQEKKPFRLYQWSGKSTPGPEEIGSADLTGLNPEAIVIYPGIKNRFQVLSDDGEEGGCKDLADDDPNKKFRSRWIEFP
jgi:hypothetical protein